MSRLYAIPFICAALQLLGAAHAAPAILTVGSVHLTRCAQVAAYCGQIERPLDPTGAVAGRLSVHFEYYPHTSSKNSLGLIVATEGGPGYAATKSRDSYLELFAPLRGDHDVLIMDNRGTGQSGAIDCPALQDADRWTVELIAACGASLGERAPFYGTSYAADDLAAILDSLSAARIDLYGDSYGTYFEQVFAVRHPTRLRSVVLDGAYPLNGPDYPWYPNYAPAMRAKFDLACRRFAPCAALGGSSMDHIRPALERLRAHPYDFAAPDAAGGARAIHADASMLATVMFAAAPALASTRELDAAARAFEAGDRVPLERLMAETRIGVDSRDPDTDFTQWSAGLSADAMCEDTPQIYDMGLPPPARRAQRDRVLAERRHSHPDAYAPFTLDEYRGMPLDYSFLDQCVEWPAPVRPRPSDRPFAAGAAYPDVPALVISGELDDITTPADGAAAAAAFKHGRQILIANSFHVNALSHARSACAAGIVRRFIGSLDPGDTKCAAAVPPLRLAPRFGRHAAELEPVSPLDGNRGSPAALQAAAAALAAAGDVLARPEAGSAGHAAGLRGGAYTVVPHGDPISIRLDHLRFTEDVAVSGLIERSQRRNGAVRARLAIEAAGGLNGVLTLRWSEAEAAPVARMEGRLGGETVRAEAPAP